VDPDNPEESGYVFLVTTQSCAHLRIVLEEVAKTKRKVANVSKTEQYIAI
jgi:hypothetical protein